MHGPCTFGPSFPTIISGLYLHLSGLADLQQRQRSALVPEKNFEHFALQTVPLGFKQAYVILHGGQNTHMAASTKGTYQ